MPHPQGGCRITFVQADGMRLSVDAPRGHTIMSVALRALVPGITGACRGNCTCVTCHIYVQPDGRKLAEPSAMEESMLDFADDVRPTSRLACQIPISADLDGLEVHVPARQRTVGL